MNIEIKKSVKPVNYIDAINIMEERLEQIFNNKEKELIWTLEHEEFTLLELVTAKKILLTNRSKLLKQTEVEKSLVMVLGN